MKVIKYFYVGLLLVCSSCSGFLDRDPLTTLSPSNFWKTEEDLRLALNILYDKMNISYTVGCYVDQLLSMDSYYQRFFGKLSKCRGDGNCEKQICR